MKNSKTLASLVKIALCTGAGAATMWYAAKTQTMQTETTLMDSNKQIEYRMSAYKQTPGKDKSYASAEIYSHGQLISRQEFERMTKK